jgi:hypothetical protein
MGEKDGDIISKYIYYRTRKKVVTVMLFFNSSNNWGKRTFLLYVGRGSIYSAEYMAVIA